MYIGLKKVCVYRYIRVQQFSVESIHSARETMHSSFYIYINTSNYSCM